MCCILYSIFLYFIRVCASIVNLPSVTYFCNFLIFADFICFLFFVFYFPSVRLFFLPEPFGIYRCFTGLANKLCIPVAEKVCCNFPETMKNIPADKAVLTGSPIRAELAEGSKLAGLNMCGFTANKPVNEAG